MYQQKIPKGERPDTSIYTIHHCHSTLKPIEWYQRKDWQRVLSIDPGKRNFCFRIETWDFTKQKISMEAYEKIDLIGSEASPGAGEHIEYINRNVISILDKYEKLIANCDLVIIERQLPINYRMVRFSQHIITYLTIKLRDNTCKTVIIEIDPRLKTQQFGIKGLDKRGVKKWAIEKANEILTLRDDQASLNIIKKAKSKKDDLSDTVVQVE